MTRSQIRPVDRSRLSSAAARLSGSPVSVAASRSASYSRERDRASCSRVTSVGSAIRTTEISSSRGSPPATLIGSAKKIDTTPRYDSACTNRAIVSDRAITRVSPDRMWLTSCASTAATCWLGRRRSSPSLIAIAGSRCGPAAKALGTRLGT
jgi:hypothetical protein